MNPKLKTDLLGELVGVGLVYVWGVCFVLGFVCFALAQAPVSPSQSTNKIALIGSQTTQLLTNWHTLDTNAGMEIQAAVITSNVLWITSDGEVSFTNVRSSTKLVTTTTPMRGLPILPTLPYVLRGSNRTPPQPPTNK